METGNRPGQKETSRRGPLSNFRSTPNTKGLGKRKNGAAVYGATPLVITGETVRVPMYLFSMGIRNNSVPEKDCLRSREKEPMGESGTCERKGIHWMAGNPPTRQYHDRWEPPIDLNTLWVPKSHAPKNGNAIDTTQEWCAPVSQSCVIDGGD